MSLNSFELTHAQHCLRLNS